MQKFLIILGVVAFFTFLFFLGSRNSDVTVSAGELSASNSRTGANLSTGHIVLSASEDVYDFKEISMEKGEVSHVFTIINSGTEPVTLSRITTSCMCTIAYLIDGARRLGPFGMPGHGGPKGTLVETIPAGGSRDVEVIFDPAAHGPAGIGRISRAVFLEDAKGEVKALKISATVVPLALRKQ